MFVGEWRGFEVGLSGSISIAPLISQFAHGAKYMNRCPGDYRLGPLRLASTAPPGVNAPSGHVAKGGVPVNRRGERSEHKRAVVGKKTFD